MSDVNNFKDKLWDKEIELYEALIKGDENNLLVKEFVSKVKKAISEVIVGTVSCMDDRLSIVDGTIRIAGSGNLLLDEIGKDKLMEIFKKLNVTKITTHNDCGAAGLYAKSNELDGDPDEITKELIDELSKDYDLNHEYIGNINVPHGARSIFIDTTARFNPSKVDGLPEGFVITAKEFPINHIIDQINVAINIAKGSHGYGNKINKSNPLFIFVIGKDGEYEELDNGIKNIEQEQDGLVKIKYIN